MDDLVHILLAFCVTFLDAEHTNLARFQQLSSSDQRSKGQKVTDVFGESACCPQRSGFVGWPRMERSFVAAKLLPPLP